MHADSTPGVVAMQASTCQDTPSSRIARLFTLCVTAGAHYNLRHFALAAGLLSATLQVPTAPDAVAYDARKLVTTSKHAVLRCCNGQ